MKLIGSQLGVIIQTRTLHFRIKKSYNDVYLKTKIQKCKLLENISAAVITRHATQVAGNWVDMKNKNSLKINHNLSADCKLEEWSYELSPSSQLVRSKDSAFVLCYSVEQVLPSLLRIRDLLETKRRSLAYTYFNIIRPRSEMWWLQLTWRQLSTEKLLFLRLHPREREKQQRPF
jgi:hypothetical protein